MAANAAEETLFCRPARINGTLGIYSTPIAGDYSADKHLRLSRFRRLALDAPSIIKPATASHPEMTSLELIYEVAKIRNCQSASK